MEEERRWEELPSDCLAHVFSKLGLEELTSGIPLACKSWHEASLHPQCWKKLDFRELDFTSGSEFARRFKHEFGVGKFSFSAFVKLCLARSRGSVVEIGFPFILGASLQQALISASIECPKLKVLSLPNLKREAEHQLHELMRKWKEIEILKLTWKPNSFIKILEEIRVNCPNFVGLHLCGFFDSAEAQAIVRCVPRLKIFMISASFLQKEALFLILDGCKELEVVDVSNCSGFEADDEILKKGARISKFECRDCKQADIYGNLSYDLMMSSWL